MAITHFWKMVDRQTSPNDRMGYSVWKKNCGHNTPSSTKVPRENTIPLPLSRQFTRQLTRQASLPGNSPGNSVPLCMFVAMLSVQNVVKRFGDHLANDHITLSAQAGRIFGLLGPNGAGKTTLIRQITNILQPDEGQILLDNKPVGELAMDRMGYLPEERGLYKKLTVGEQITYFGELKGLSHREAAQRGQAWLQRLDAAGWEGKKIQELSKGMQQKVQFITTILHEPQLVILDEPFSGLDPVNAQLLIDTVRSLQNEGTTVILSTHQMDQVEKLCDDIALIHRGKVVLNGSVREVKAGYRSDRVVLEFHGNEQQLTDLPGTTVVNLTAGRVELRLTSPDISSDDILRTAIDRVSITRFEVAEPSLHDIFVKVVSE